MREKSEEATRHTLARDFRALGVESGDIVMLHASYRAVRPVKGGPDTVIDALKDSVTQNGGVVMFVSWAHSTYDVFADRGPSEAERLAWPAFDPDNAPVRPTHGGAVGACLAQRAESLRSRNPDRSLVALGSAALLLTDHPLNHGFGPGSPLERLYECGAKTLNLGAPLYTATILHYAEYLARVPEKRYVRYEVPILEHGRKVWHQVTQMNRDAFVAAAESLDPDYLEQVIRAYLGTGRHSEGKVGAAQAYLFEMADLVPFAVRYLENRFG
jgi:aminoglycoside 3-N-acetyltransferase/aminoglycoside 3-N-acetyltransferase-2